MSACTDAGDAIMEVYDGKQPMDVASKKDDSPVTAADIAAHKVIISGLLALTPDIPVLSKKTRRPGRCASTGSATGWWTRWTAPKSLSSATVNLPSISP
jgi:3'-phosphoadenosine 5'-phosphosulfate (PAPS) 3'-phosphatase